MENQIIVKLNQGILEQTVYIFTDESDTIPLIKTAPMDQLVSLVTMSAAKYNVRLIKLSGARTFALGVKNQLTEKIQTCFGKTDDFTIEFM